MRWIRCCNQEDSNAVFHENKCIISNAREFSAYSGSRVSLPEKKRSSLTEKKIDACNHHTQAIYNEESISRDINNITCTSKTLKVTWLLNQVVRVSVGVIRYRNFACFYPGCLSDGVCHNQEYVSDCKMTTLADL